jgi:thiamine pyrophosphokinase
MKVLPHGLLLRRQLPFALIVANTSICHLAIQFWRSSNAKYRILADGAADRMRDLCVQSYLPLPDYVVGDFDSASQESLAHYRNLGVQVVKDENQDINDLEKCVNVIPRGIPVVMIGVFGRRLDHEFGAINVAYRHKEKFDFLMLSQDNLAALVSPGKTRIQCDMEIQGPACGVVPLGVECKSISSKGLRWNLENHVLKFGGLVSTSNILDEKNVDIETSDPVLWMTQLQG